MLQLILYGLIAGLFSLIGGAVVIWRPHVARRIMTLLLTFAAGAFLAVAFLDLLPEAVELVEESHEIFLAFLVGFTAFFGLERWLMVKFHKHEEGATEHTESLPFLVILGDTLHNFLDGVLIALAYAADPLLALPTALAVAAHELPQEIGDFAVLLDQGWSKIKILAVNIASSLFSVLGVLFGYLFIGLVEGILPYLLAGTAGVFTYIASSDLIPEIHHRAGHRHFFKVLAVFVLALLIIWRLVEFAHG